MRKLSLGLAVVLAGATGACSQGNSDNVMSPEANALEPADVNAALGPEVTTTDANLAANDINAVDNSSTNSTAPALRSSYRPAADREGE
jgi:hypothetical protein